MEPGALVGRDAELHDLDDRLRASRLVTVVGPGGVGKTALARAGALTSASRFPLGVKSVDLTRVESVASVPGALAAQLGFDSIDALLGSPADRPVLLVVDNCEHLLDAVAHWIMRILDVCQQPTVLATSRSPLEVPGESVLSLAPLAVPGPERDPRSFASVQLLLRRCREAGVASTSDDLPAVVELCRRVDGLPLAIEIAAARARTMSFDEIVRRLDASVDVLDRPRFRGDPRHRSVADTIRWSSDLLSPEAARLFEELAVFAGPFSAAAARDVASVDAVEFDALIEELAYASLVRVDTGASETRYRLLETVRHFALDRLRRRGDLEACYDRFADHVVASVQQIVRGSTRTWRPGLFRDLAVAFDDLAEALRWCTEHDTEPQRAHALCTFLWAMVHQGRAEDIAELARRTIGRWPDHGSPDGAQCVAALASAEYVTGHPQRALDLATSTLAALGSPCPASVALRRVEGQSRRAIGDIEGALRAFQSGIEAAHELAMPPMAMELEITAAVVAADGGDLSNSVAALVDLAERATTCGSAITESWARAALGWLLLRVDAAAALPVIEAGLVEARRIDYPIAVAVQLRSLVYARLLADDVRGAVAAAVELLDDLLARGALSNARLLVDSTSVLAHRCDHPAWAPLAATARALPITTLVAADFQLVSLPETAGPEIGRHQVITTVRTVLEELSGRQTSMETGVAGDSLRERVGRIERRGDTYEIAFADRTISVRGSKGLDDIVRLIEAEGSELHCLDLAGAGVEERSMGPVLDDTARRDYERRIRELQEEIEEAEHNNDSARTYKRQVELDAIIDHLTLAVGAGNRTRSAGGTAERARSAVTHRIRATIRLLEKRNPNLGRHLAHAVNTGTYCSYRPEHPVAWHIG